MPIDPEGTFRSRLDAIASSLQVCLQLSVLDQPEEILLQAGCAARCGDCDRPFGQGCLQAAQLSGPPGKSWACRRGMGIAGTEMALPDGRAVRLLLGPAPAEMIDCLKAQCLLLEHVLLSQAETQMTRRRLESDLQARKAVQEMMSGRMHFLQQLIDRIPNPIYYTDPTGRYLGCNELYSRLVFSAPRSRILGRTILELQDLISPSLAELYQSQQRDLLTSGGLRTFEAPVQLQDGSTRYYEFHKSTLQDADGRESGLLCVMVDITRRVELVEALAEARATAESAARAKTEFLTHVSHEIRTPMLSLVDLLELRGLTELDGHQRSQLEQIESCARTLMRMLDEILDFSYIESGKARTEMTVFDLHQSLTGAVRSAMPAATAEGTELSLEIQPLLPRWIRCDRGRLRKILDLLLFQAIAAGAGTPVQLRARWEERAVGQGTLVVVVHTPQPGRSEQARHGEKGQKPSEMGLAMTICAKQAELIGGRLLREPGRWDNSALRLSLPLNLPDQLPWPTLEAPIARTLRVLVFSSDDALQQQLAEQLSGWGAAYDQAADLVSAQTFLAGSIETGRFYSHVILDGRLEVSDRSAFAQQLQSNPAVGAPTPLLVCSAGQEPAEPSDPWTILSLPLLDRELIDALSGQFDRQGRSGNGHHRPLRILVAEDNSVTQVVLRQLLEQMGHSVQIASNGIEALIAVESRDLDLVFMDVQMPEMDGLAAAGAIRQREQVFGTHLPIVALSGRDELESSDLCLAAGMDGYLTKPVRVDQLREAIEQMVPSCTGCRTLSSGR